MITSKNCYQRNAQWARDELHPQGRRSLRLLRAAVGRSGAESGRAAAKPDDSSIEQFGGCERRERPPNGQAQALGGADQPPPPANSKWIQKQIS
jgi:hypothetical protein